MSRETKSLITQIRDGDITFKTFTSLTLFFFLFTFYSPSLLAAKQEIEKITEVEEIVIEGNTSEEKLANTFQLIKLEADITEEDIAKRLEEEGNILQAILSFIGVKHLAPEKLEKLAQLNENMETLHEDTLAGFQDVERMLIEKELPEEILQRHYTAVEQYSEKFEEYQSKYAAVKSATSLKGQQKAHKALNTFMGEQKFKRSHQPFDPSEVGERALKPNPDNTPKTTKDQFADNGLNNTPYVQLAGLGDFTFDQLPGADNPAYLAESDEVTLSQAIQDQAQALNYDPIQIHHFVRNNIEWIPSWGAIQNADLTLSARRGNAMDIASLTIALLRASQIPARYVHGTIDVAPDKFMNWAGGFTNINAALDYAASAGIPITQLISGGQIAKVRMEHVWVETAADFFPSRGAKNIAADSWVQLDPSFKQYDFLEGLDAVQISGIDTDQLAQDFLDSGTVNETEGWVTGFDPTILETAQTNAQAALEDYINNNLQDPTVGDVIGGRQTIIKEYPTLPSSLPNNIIVEGARYDQLPNSLQQTIGWAFGIDLFGVPTDITRFTYGEINNEKVTLSFRPATQADQDALEGLLPEGEITDISQLPSSIPAYLIDVVPELKVNEVVVKTGSSMSLGEEITLVTEVSFVSQGQRLRTYNVIAGSYLILNTIAQSLSSGKIEDVQTRLIQTQTILDSEDQFQFESLTNENIMGDMFYSGSLAYYSQLVSFGEIGVVNQGLRFQLSAGIGTVGYEPNVNTFFGFPRSIESGGISFDIPFYQVTQTTSGDMEELKNFNLQVGVLSSMLEHATPEQMISEAGTSPSAISTVKALELAILEGQRVYSITKSNQSEVMPLLNHDGVTEGKITESLNVGKMVIVHSDPVGVPGWIGTGYAVLDPETNVGAWIISGGNNGAFLMDISDDLEKALFVVSKFEKSLGKLGVVGKALSKVVSQVKRLIQTIKNIIDIVAKCGAFAILGILFSLAALYFSLKISAVITAGAAAVGTALCGPICGGAFLLIAAVTIVAKINEVYGQITDDIIGGCDART